MIAKRVLAGIALSLVLEAAQPVSALAAGKPHAKPLSSVVDGVQVVGFSSEWEVYGGIFTPRIDLKLKNVSKSDVGELEIRTTFLDTKKKVVFGDGTEYVVGYGDSPLRPQRRGSRLI